MKRLINWFEIPVSDIERATRFYEAVFVTKLTSEACQEGMKMAVFPYADGQTGGSLTQFAQYKPSADGTIIYLDTPQMEAALERVQKAGGQTIFGPYVLPDNIGRIALFIDSEGNRIGLHEEPAKRD